MIRTNRIAAFFAPALLAALAFKAPRADAADAGQVKSATDRAANWLIEQHKDGTFGKGDLRKKPGVVGLVVKSLCAHHRHYREPLGPFITEPVKYLLKCQKKDGSFADNGDDAGLATYHTAMAVQALAATENPKYAPNIEKARDYLLKCQSNEGAFGYQANARQGGDLSNTWCALVALKDAKLDAKNDAWDKARVFITRCQDSKETNPDMVVKGCNDTGGAYYQPGHSEFGTEQGRGGSGPRPYGSMTAAAIEGYVLCGTKTDAPEVQQAIKWFSRNFRNDQNPGGGKAGYYYYTFAFARAMTTAGVDSIEIGGKQQRWCEVLAEGLLKQQDKDGFFVNKESPKWMEDSPILCTAYALQALNLCYKPLKAGPPTEQKKEKEADD